MFVACGVIDTVERAQIVHHRFAAFLIDCRADPRIPGWMQLTAVRKAEGRKDQEGQRVYALLKSVAARLGDS